MKSKKYTKKAFVFLKLLSGVTPIFLRTVRITEIGDTRITEDGFIRVTERSS